MFLTRYPLKPSELGIIIIETAERIHVAEEASISPLIAIPVIIRLGIIRGITVKETKLDLLLKYTSTELRRIDTAEICINEITAKIIIKTEV